MKANHFLKNHMNQDWQLFYLFEDPDLGPNFTPATTIPHNTVPGSEARKSSLCGIR